jgi:DNA-binding transcriptional MerR regulator
MPLLDIFKKKKPAAFPPAAPMPPGLPPGAPFGAPPAPQFPGAPTVPPMPGEIPVSQVMGMLQQGTSNDQIIQELQRQGFSPQQIYDALAQAEARKSISPGVTAPPGGPPPAEVPEMMPSGHPPIEEVAESIIEEKWTLLQKDLAKINEWKELMASRMDKLEQSTTDLKTDLDGLHKAIVARVGEYDKTLMNVGTEIKAMEKVFQKVLPELTGNIQELSRITKTAKEKGIKTEKGKK